MPEIFTIVFLGLGIVVIVGGIVMILGFIVSMPFGVAAAAKEHHENPLPPEPRTPHYRQMRMHLRTWRMPTMNDFRNIKLPKMSRR